MCIRKSYLYIFNLVLLQPQQQQKEGQNREYKAWTVWDEDDTGSERNGITNGNLEYLSGRLVRPLIGQYY